MGQTILTPHQSQFLELVGQEPDLVKDYYFTGGTALTEYYLKHRISEDIDLFTERFEVDQILIEAFLKKISEKLINVNFIHEHSARTSRPLALTPSPGSLPPRRSNQGFC